MIRRRPAVPWLQTAAALLALGYTGWVHAQGGPVVVGQTPETHVLSLLPPRLALELLYRHQGERSAGDDNGTSNQEDRFEETLQLSTTGSLYHPNIVDLSLSGTFGLSQTWRDDGDTRDLESGTLYEWDVSSSFLRKEPVGVTLYSRQHRGRLDREFGPSIDTTATTYGGILDLRLEWLPTRFEYSHSLEDQAGIGDTPGYTLTQDAATWHSDFSPSEQQHLSWDFSQIWTHEYPGNAPSETFDTRDMSLAHTFQFGDDDRYRLDSLVREFRQTGGWDRRQRRWEENLVARHAESFSSRYRYLLEQNSFSAADETQQTVETAFTHQWYESLTTTGTLGLKDLQRDDRGGSFDTYASLTSDYRKRIPFGQLTVNLSAVADRQRNKARSGPTQVANAEVTFGDAGPITLVGSQIIPSSVVVSDAITRLTYTRGFDYTLTPFADHVELERVVGGRIRNGQRVHIDYQLAPAAANTTTTTTESVGARYDIQQGFLKGLGLYTRLATQDQTVDSRYPLTSTPNTYDDSTFGADYRLWRLTFALEHRNHDSAIAPFRADHASARYAQRLAQETTLHLNSGYTVTRYPQSSNTVDLLTLGASLQHQFTERLSASASVLWRDEEDRREGSTRGFEQELQLQWSIRQTSAYLLFRNASLDTLNDNRSYQLLRVGLRREF